jgi:hypothetical protein
MLLPLMQVDDLQLFSCCTAFNRKKEKPLGCATSFVPRPCGVPLHTRLSVCLCHLVLSTASLSMSLGYLYLSRSRPPPKHVLWMRSACRR